VNGVIEISNLCVRYPRTGTVLSSVSMSIERGEFVVLLGRSGAGKSSLLRAINYLVRPSAGSIAVAGVGKLGSRRSLMEHRRRTGMVFQQHQLILRLTALDNVLVGRLGRYPAWRSFGPFARAEVAAAFDCLRCVGLADHALRRADELSGGERQRVGIARALAQQPQLLLVDEPVASLDPQTAATIMTLLRDICRAGRLTALVSLHQLELALGFADRIIGLAGGRVVVDGAPADLTDHDLTTILGRASVEAMEIAPFVAAKADPSVTDSAAIENLEHEMLIRDD
jgi:phosphonate transport system ATP-binding protein